MTKEEYYSPQEIIFTWHQCQWMVINVLPLDYGKWANDPRETGYVGSDHLPAQHAPFELICCVVGELRKRLDRTGKDGKLMVKTLQAERGWEMDYDEKMALAYCCGKKAKRQLYPRWKADKIYKSRSVK